MYNNASDHNVIQKGFEEGLIDLKDYQLYLESQQNKDAFKKGCKEGTLSESVYDDAINNLNKGEFIRVNENGRMRFKYALNHGQNSEPIMPMQVLPQNVPEKKAIKKSETVTLKPLDMSTINEIIEMAAVINRRKQQ